MRFFVKNLSLRAVGYVMLGISASSVSLLGGNSLSTQDSRVSQIATPPHQVRRATTSPASPQELSTVNYYWTLALIKLHRWCKEDREILFWALNQPADVRQAYIKVLLDGHPQRKSLASSTNLDRSTLLHQAAKLGDITVTHALLEAEANHFAKDNRRATPLHIAAQYGAPSGLIYLLLASLDSDKLRDYLEARDIVRKTPLLLASQHHHPVLVQLLIEEGANTQAVDKYDHNALHLALNPGVEHGKGRRSRRKPLSSEAAQCISILSRHLDIHALNIDSHTLWDMSKNNTVAKQVIRRVYDARKVKLQEVLEDTIPYMPADLCELIIKFEGSDTSAYSA